MEYRPLGSAAIQVSEIGFGCGNVGGLMIRGERSAQVRAVARALELGINYFDTAPSYGDGQSETNLGQALKGIVRRRLRRNQVPGHYPRAGAHQRQRYQLGGREPYPAGSVSGLT